MIKKLVCSRCGQGDFGWSYKTSMLACAYCKLVTRWITIEAYRKKQQKKESSKYAATH